MKILVAEHHPAQRQALVGFLEAEGHEVLATDNSAEAITVFTRHQPELVLMDVALPNTDGYRCTRMICTLASDRFVPVILSTSISDHVTLDRFIESGAVDLIDKPHNLCLLKAKISGYRRMRELHNQVEYHQSRLNQEIKLARHMFDSVLSQSSTDVAGFRQWAITAGHFSGDLLIYERTPSGGLHVLMGDFTGHGLAAAVGALPTADLFLALTRKGTSLAEIVHKINERLHRLLPTGHFCAATLACLDLDASSIEIWNGGQPPPLLIDEAQQVAHRVASTHFPLGMMGTASFEAVPQWISLAGIRHIVLYSDGLIEARNAQGDAFGEDGLAAAAISPQGSGNILRGIKTRLIGFLDGMAPHDDVMLLVIDLAAAKKQHAQATARTLP